MLVPLFEAPAGHYEHPPEAPKRPARLADKPGMPNEASLGEHAMLFSALRDDRLTIQLVILQSDIVVQGKHLNLLFGTLAAQHGPLVW